MSSDSAIKVTVREFATQLRGISPEMQEVEVTVIVERLREEHGIVVEEETILEMVG